MNDKSEIFIRLQSIQPKYIWRNIKQLGQDKRNGNFSFKDSLWDITQNIMIIKHIASIRVTMPILYFSVLCSDLLDPEEICIWWQQAALVMSCWSHFPIRNYLKVTMNFEDIWRIKGDTIALVIPQAMKGHGTCRTVRGSYRPDRDLSPPFSFSVSQKSHPIEVNCKSWNYQGLNVIVCCYFVPPLHYQAQIMPETWGHMIWVQESDNVNDVQCLNSYLTCWSFFPFLACLLSFFLCLLLCFSFFLSPSTPWLLKGCAKSLQNHCTEH